jgi:5-methyltetrahydrofolate--homocysteine methyltransferase
METLLKGSGKTVTIDNEGTFTIIGESINPTRRKKLIETLQAGDFNYALSLAETQIAFGADILDINVGFPGVDDVKLLPAVVNAVSEKYSVPLCLDTPNPNALAAGLAAVQGKALVNSVNGEEKSLEAILPIVKEYGAAVIGLCMDDNGISNDPEERVSIAGMILERAAKIGIAPENIVIDPLVMSVGSDDKAGMVCLQTIALVRREFGVNITMGASNVSFGLPEREIINQAFLVAAMYAGASCAITNPVKLTSIIRAADLLLARDEYAGRYIKHYRTLQKLGASASG